VSSDLRPAVLLVLAGSTGGIGRHVGALADQLPGRGFEVYVCAPGHTLAAIGIDATAVRPVPAPVERPTPAALLSARRALRGLATKVDITHAHGLRAGALCAAFLPTSPLVVSWHNAVLGGGPRRAGHAAVARYVARSADLTLAASPDLLLEARNAGAKRARTDFVVAPPLPAPTRSPAEVRAALGVGSRPLVLAIGRLQRQKRLDVLVDAAAAWAGDPAAPAVVIAGEGPERARLAARIRAGRAPVELLGSRRDVADLLGAADVVALPSEWEARALVAQEALAAGVALVTTAVGGLPDLLGDAAVWVPVGDAVALRTAIEGLVNDDVRRRGLAIRGQARARGWPDAERSIDELSASYLDLTTRVRRERA
jgi:glycosyltransferase involved in cell wall biosynthesis